MLKITARAADRFKEILAKEQKEQAYIRLYISGMG
jgi:Fe-S cluster assembly iron-binding protein IscA